MTTLRVAIVDDEELARRVLREYLDSYEDVEIVAECANGFEAVKVVTDLKPDLLLLDIQMPRLDGFEVLELIGHEVGVIFVTDYVVFRTEGRQYLKQQTLGEVENNLDPAQFVRIHRSYIINIDRLAKIELYAKDSHAAILRDGTRLPVSRSGYARLNAVLK